MALIHLVVDDDYIESFVKSFDRDKIKIVERDFELNQKKFQDLLSIYQNNSDHFESFYQGVDSILKSKLFDEQLDEILKSISSIDENVSKQFESYLNTIILNMQTKINKYKKSIYFDNETVKDIEFQGCTIPFFIDESKNRVILLGISAKS